MGDKLGPCRDRGGGVAVGIEERERRWRERSAKEGKAGEVGMGVGIEEGRKEGEGGEVGMGVGSRDTGERDDGGRGKKGRRERSGWESRYGRGNGGKEEEGGGIYGGRGRDRGEIKAMRGRRWDGSRDKGGGQERRGGERGRDGSRDTGEGETMEGECEEAEATAERWKAEALRPGNKRDSIAVGTTPMMQARVRIRTGGNESPKAHVETPRRHVEIDLKGIAERHQAEVEALQTLRINEMNAQRESESEVEKLKEALARLEMEKRTATRGTNLKTRLDEAATNKERTNGVTEGGGGTSAQKDKDKDMNQAAESVDRYAFVRANRKDLRGKNKEFVIKICEKEGVNYTTLDPTKEAIVQARAAKTFDDDARRERKGKDVATVSISDDVAGPVNDQDESAAS
ncbi:hypothetical protein CBR_g628 [Chara braunii]|uniref:Uncharacterized protein n=1 Tax=Chara braunii TaxID=69332 RepID=A0A388KC13_CHABU|nr:hypothetical protein CBR_g628 [Chara braunii]|eukprot:GBG67493.1 hypothetical protein CBR_g628 [Chara braunii]